MTAFRGPFVILNTGKGIVPLLSAHSSQDPLESSRVGCRTSRVCLAAKEVNFNPVSKY